MNLLWCLIYAGLILGVFQTIRLVRLDADLTKLLTWIERRQLRPESRFSAERMRTRNIAAVQCLLATLDARGPLDTESDVTLAKMAPIPALSPELEREEAVQLLLNDLIERFSADSAAVLTGEGSQQVQVLQIHRNGIKGERLRETLISRFKDYFQRGQTGVFGPRDHVLERCISGDLSWFGFNQSLSGQVTATHRFVFWLGFVRSKPSISACHSELELYLERVRAQLLVYQKGRSLEERYAFEKKQGEEKEKLLAYAAHDMRSPINSIRYTLMLFNSFQLTVEQRELIETMRGDCEMLSDIVDDARDYSQYRAGLLKARKGAIDCGQLIEQVCRIFEPSIRAKKLGLACSIPDDLIMLGDRRQLARIFTNIVGNAVKYTEKGFVSITGSVNSDQQIVISVKDSGVGMNQEDIDRAFEPYARFASPEIEGSGLGLTLSRAFAELNDCQLHIHSDPGEGTRVTISVPGCRRELENFPESTQKKMRVLLADDHRDAAASLARILQARGFVAIVANSIESAKFQYVQSKPDFLLTDLTFSDGPGELLIRYVLQEDSCAQIIIVSGREVRVEDRDLLERREIFYLQKPVDVETLVGRIKGEECCAARGHLRAGSQSTGAEAQAA